MKRALITGSSRGIGKAVAEKFLGEGWAVVGTSTSGKEPAGHDDYHIYKLDQADPESIRKFVSNVAAPGAKFDVLINNAAVALDENNAVVDVELLRRTLEVNVIGLIDLTERMIPYINRDGHIVNISSGSGAFASFSGVWAPSYMISKAALNMYTKILAENLERKNITVSAITPGWVKTDMGGMEADRRPEDAAEDIFKLAASKVETGFFWSRGRKKPW